MNNSRSKSTVNLVFGLWLTAATLFLISALLPYFLRGGNVSVLYLTLAGVFTLLAFVFRAAAMRNKP